LSNRLRSDSFLAKLLESGSISHDTNHPLLELRILPRMLVEDAVLGAFSPWVNGEELRERADFVPAGKISDSRSIYLNKSNLVRPVPRSHIFQNLIEIIQAVVAIRAIFHVCVNENELVFVLTFDQGEIFIVILNWPCFTLLPPSRGQVSSCLHHTGEKN